MSQILLNDPQRIGGSSALALNDDLGIVGPANAAKLALWAADINTMFGEIYSRLGYQIGVQIPFTTVLPFQSIAYMPPQSVAGPLAFTVGSSPVLGSQCAVRLTADGTNIPTFNGKALSGWMNVAGVVNFIIWNYYAAGAPSYYCSQDGASAGAPLIFRPAVASLIVPSGKDSTLTIATSGAALNPNDVPAPSAFTITSMNVAINKVSVSPYEVSLALTGTVNSGDTVTVSYTPPNLASSQAIRGGNRLRDASGNSMAAITAAPVTVN